MQSGRDMAEILLSGGDGKKQISALHKAILLASYIHHPRTLLGPDFTLVAHLKTNTTLLACRQNSSRFSQFSAEPGLAQIQFARRHGIVINNKVSVVLHPEVRGAALVQGQRGRLDSVSKLVG
jgi:hypothetical protein